MNLKEHITAAFKRLIDDQVGFSKDSGVSQPTISRFKKGILGGDALLKALEALGAQITFPDEASQRDQTREVTFVNAKVVNAVDGAPPIIPEDYLSVPLISEAGAGPGVVPHEEFESWFLVYRNEPSIQTRSDLIAVRIAKGSTSMQPTLHPGDVVLVDRKDKNVNRPGHIWLVMDPDGDGKVKRVAMDRVPEERHTRLTFYSDNAKDNPPDVYILERDYEGEIGRAIVGRVVWAWSDVTRK